MLVPPHSATAALAWANRLYGYAAPLPQGCNPMLDVGKALDAYRRVLARYPHSRANVGVGDCLMLLGCYSEAAKAYGHSPLGQEARRRQAIARAARRLVPGRQVVQIERAPGSAARWLVLAAHVKPDSRYSGDLSPGELTSVGLLLVQEDSHGVHPVGQERVIVAPVKNPIDDSPPRSVILYRSRLTQKGTPVLIVFTDWPGADNDTNEQRLFRIRPKALEPVGRFFGKSATSFAAPTAMHGLVAYVTPTWKVWWTDRYEWRNERFVFANVGSVDAHSPADYRPEGSDRDSYVVWLKYASALAIHRRYRASLRALRHAEHTCQMSLWYGAQASNRYRDGGYFGDKRENLKEIRRRIGWLQKGDYDHALLYRPYDWDLQVPPYRLGHAAGAR